MPKVASTQMSIDWDVDTNLDKAEAMVRKAAKAGARSSCCRNFSPQSISALSSTRNILTTRMRWKAIPFSGGLPISRVSLVLSCRSVF